MSKFVAALERVAQERIAQSEKPADGTRESPSKVQEPPLPPTSPPWLVAASPSRVQEPPSLPLVSPPWLDATSPSRVQEPPPPISPSWPKAATPSRVQKRPRPPISPSSLEADSLAEHLVSLTAPASFEAEQYRVLRHRIEQLHKSHGLAVIAVSSPGAADGKTTTAINLAGALAQGRAARVLLVDADLRAPAVVDQLGLGRRQTPGLVNAILQEDLSLDAVVQACPHLNLSVLSAGRIPSAPYEVLQSSRMGELFADARTRYDYIVVDTPPLVSVPDCRVIGKWVDGFLIVVGAHRTSRKLLEEALDSLELPKIVGLVFNGDDRHFSRGYYTAYTRGRSANARGGQWRRRRS